jgi:serine phosphatase RsbU (regulator of sigma subunit)
MTLRRLRELLRAPASLYFSIAACALAAKTALDAFTILFSDGYAALSGVISLLGLLSFAAGMIIREAEWHESNAALEPELYIVEELPVLARLTGIAALINLTQFLVSSTRPDTFFSSLTSNLFGSYSVIVGGLIISFCYRLMYIRQHKNSKLYTRYILIVSGILLLILSQILGKSSEAGFIWIIPLGLFLINTKRLQWVATLGRNAKIRLTKYAALAFIASVLWGTLTADSQDSAAFSALLFLNPLALAGTQLAQIFFLGITLRLLLAGIIALPTAGVLDRRAMEVASLARLTRTVAQTADLAKLFDAVAELALDVSKAGSVWCEVYSHGLRTTASMVGISSEQVELLHDHEEFAELIQNCERPMLLPSIQEDPKLMNMDKAALNIAQCVLAVPLYAGEERIGTLIALHKESYFFEPRDLKVLAAFSDNVSIALENARLLRESLQAERIQREMQLARQIQRKLLPQTLPILQGFSIAAVSYPASEVGGDYYDVFPLHDGRLCIIIADVSGKGLPAAFYMAKLKGIVLALSRQANGAADMVCKINATLYGAIEKQTYITLSCLVIDPITRHCVLARAGHMPTLASLLNEKQIITPKGLGIGLANSKLFDASVEEYTMLMNPGDSCLLFTDGVSERRNMNADEIGYQPLLDILDSNNGARGIIENLQIQLREFSEGTEPHDDITAIAVVCHMQSETEL